MVNVEVTNNTAILKLNRPEKRNALNPELVAALKDSLSELEQNDNIKSVILTGEGKSFCAGADLNYLKSLADYSTIENEKDSENLAELFLSIYTYPKPVVAAVNGAAIAGGCGLASVCDLIVGHPTNSKFGYSEVKIGFIPAIVSTFLLKRVGEGIANELLLTGNIIDGKRAYEIGFVNYLSDNVMEKAFEIADLLNNNSTTSIYQTKKMIKDISSLSFNNAVDLCVKLNVISRNTEDYRIGLSKFINKEQKDG